MSKCRFDLSENCNNTDCLNCVLEKIKKELLELTEYFYIEPDVFRILDEYISKMKGSEENEML